MNLEFSKIDSSNFIVLKADYLIRKLNDYNFERFDMLSKHGDPEVKKFLLKCVSCKQRSKINK